MAIWIKRTQNLVLVLKGRPGNKMEAHDATMYKQAAGNSSSMGCFREAQELELVFIQ